MVFEAPALMQSIEMVPGEIMIVAPNQEHYLRHVGANHYADLLITPDELSAYPGAAEAAVLRRSSAVLPADPAVAAARVQTFRWLLAAISSEGPTMSTGSAEFFRRALLDLMIRPVLDSVDYREPLLRQSETTLVRKVERYLIDAGTRPVHITELIERFNVHERRLYRAFDEVLGIGPITFLRHKRLGDVHTALLRGGSDLMIKDIAKEHGFLDYTAFDDQYQKLFDEKPSHTLRRGRRWQQKGAK